MKLLTLRLTRTNYAVAMLGLGVLYYLGRHLAFGWFEALWIFSVLLVRTGVVIPGRVRDAGYSGWKLVALALVSLVPFLNIALGVALLFAPTKKPRYVGVVQDGTTRWQEAK